jgi:hypothetical protein
VAIPEFYTEATLALFMRDVLGPVADDLELNVGADDAGDFEEAVNDTILAADIDSLEVVTDRPGIKKIRSLARVAAWRFAQGHASAHFDVSVDGGSYSESQLAKNIETKLKQAEAEAMPYDPAYVVRRSRIVNREDPYAFQPLPEG